MQSLWMLFAAFSFSVMGMLVKLAADMHSPWELLLWRNAVGLVVLVPIVRQMQGGLRKGLATPHWPAHVVRNVSGTIAVALWFTSISHLPLATSTTLNYTSSLFIGFILFTTSAWAGQPLRNGPMLASLGLGFVGIVLILHPTVAEDQLGWAMVGLASGTLSAIALMSVRAMGKLGEPSSRIVFYFSLSGCIVGLLGAVVSGAHWPDAKHLALLLGIGVSAVLGQLAATRAFSVGKALFAATLNYVGILFASFWGWFIWGDRVPAIAWLGIVFVIVAGVTATWLTMNASRPQPATE